MPTWVGTLLFAVLFFFARLGADWLFRSVIPDHPMPPMWSVLLTIGLGTTIATVVVFYLLRALRRQEHALDELNHELRNALQVLAYVIPSCDAKFAAQAEGAISRMKETVTRVSRELGHEHGADHPRRRSQPSGRPH
jgi:hypothetical protein